MTELMTIWLAVLLALALLALLCYILRDIARERRAEQFWGERTQRVEREHTKTLRRRIEDNRDDVARGLGRR